GGTESGPPWLADGQSLPHGRLVVFVETPRWASASPEQKRALEENLRFAEDLGAEPIRVQGSDVARALMRIGYDKNVGAIGRIFFLDLAGGRVVSATPDGGDIKTIVVEGRKLPDGL